MKQGQKLARFPLLPLVAFLSIFSACGGGSPVSSVGPNAQKPSLVGIQIGRLVDIYSYRRIDLNDGDRRRRFNRSFELIAKDVVIDPNIASDVLFDAAGEEVPTANYEIRPFDKEVGHEELVILWDDREGAEKSRFDAAFAACQTGLIELAPSYRGQNTQLRPVPVVPRNAALRLQFSGSLNVAENFFSLYPSALQLLEFKGDPNVVDPAEAFRILPYRVISKDDHLILDTTILGGEGSQTSAGLPQSTDSVTANIRVAIPSRGGVVSTFYIKEDDVPELNGVDSAGRPAVIRDFRSGNESDGASGKLADSERPMIIASLAMGITDVDPINNIVTLDKRSKFVPIRGRYPFVDGPIDSSDLPLGPVAVPTTRALRSGDILTQKLLVNMPDGSIEQVTVRAEVLQNLEVGTVVGGTLPIGRIANAPAGQEQGQMLTTARVRLATVDAGRDSLGRVWSFQGSSVAGGRDCVLRAHYYENVPFGSGTSTVSDRDWRHVFVRVEPEPPQGSAAGTEIDPISSLSVEFTKPLDLEEIDNTENLLITNTSILVETFDQQLSDPKRATARVVPTRLSDIGGDGTLLRLQPPLGFFHRNGNAETYALHVKLGDQGVLDLGGNPIDLFDDPTSPETSWSVDFTLAATALDNNVGWHSWLFNDADEDGSLPGSVDLFGQFRLQDGRLLGAAGVRFSRTADNQNLGAISRIHRGECWDKDLDPTATVPPLPLTAPQVLPDPTSAPVDSQGNPHPGLLYWNPRFFDQIFPPNVPQVFLPPNQPQNVGRIIEPLNPRGSRMQMRYIEDDFSLDYHQAAEMSIDVDQLYWSPFNDETVFFDVFDRFSMSLSHANTRPDEFFYFIPADPTAMPPVPAKCQYACPTNNSALSATFADNVLEGTEQVPVLEDVVYEVNPNAAFRSPFNVKYVPFPRFDRSYTWRDSRLVTVDSAGQVIGLGGAQNPLAAAPNDDYTARISSPWITDAPPANFVNAGLSLYCIDEGDFKGDERHDHDPIALPLLVDFKVFPDDPLNGIAAGSNSFQVATLGSPSFGFPNFPGGYYDTLGAGCGVRPPWPWVRVQASGGTNQITGQPIYIDPANQLTAQQSSLKDAGLGNQVTGLFTAPPGDGMLNWAQADFVRKVSTMTFGFIDTLQPQRAEFVQDPTGTPTVQTDNGFPNLLAISPTVRIRDLITQLDPPQGRQPAGTSVVLEMRGAESFDNDDKLYNPSFDQAGQTPDDTFDGRGNLLNPNYACEAYRYSQANHSSDLFGARDTPRVAASGLTAYVTEDQIAQIRDPATGLLPRFLNLRLVMTNNVDVTPALSPSLRSMSVVYRVEEQ